MPLLYRHFQEIHKIRRPLIIKGFYLGVELFAVKHLLVVFEGLDIGGRGQYFIVRGKNVNRPSVYFGCDERIRDAGKYRVVLFYTYGPDLLQVFQTCDVLPAHAMGVSIAVCHNSHLVATAYTQDRYITFPYKFELSVIFKHRQVLIICIVAAQDDRYRLSSEAVDHL